MWRLRVMVGSQENLKDCPSHFRAFKMRFVRGYKKFFEKRFTDKTPETNNEEKHNRRESLIGFPPIFDIC